MWRRRLSCGLLTVGALVAINAGPALAFNVPAAGGEIAVTNLPSLDKSWGSPIMIPMRVPTADKRVGYYTSYDYGDGIPYGSPLGIFLSYFPPHVSDAQSHPPIVQVWAWDNTTVQHILAIAVAHQKGQIKIGGSGYVRSFTAGRYQGKVVQETAYSGFGSRTYIWHYSGVTYLVGVLTNKDQPYLGGLSPTTMIASFRRP